VFGVHRDGVTVIGVQTERRREIRRQNGAIGAGVEGKHRNGP
jgi:hypothetical protein